MAKRKCTKCRKEKPNSEFVSKDGTRLNRQCSACSTAHYRAGGSTSPNKCASAVELMRRRTSPNVVSSKMTHVGSRKGFEATNVYARTRDGLFVHQSGNGFTTDRRRAWTGTLYQFDVMCARFGHTGKVSPVRVRLYTRRLDLNSPTEF